MQNTIFITYYIPDKFYHFDELSSHTTVALAQLVTDSIFSIKTRK